MLPGVQLRPIVEEQTLHYSAGKSGVDQIPPDFLYAVGEVFTYGANKYKRDNWKLGIMWSEIYGSALRHLLRFWRGEWLDDESGLPHLAHLVANAAFLFYYYTRGKGEDNRDLFDEEKADGQEVAESDHRDE